jgi:isopentenyl-diphosphate Delta-isomerase
MTRIEAPGEQVILVDDNDRMTGSMEKMEAHRSGALHRAFSLFLFDDQGRTLLQQRAAGKYHSAGLWSNACCGHPRPGEDLLSAVVRRSMEELGTRVAPVHRFTFRYHAHFANGLQEHEIDHVFFATTNMPGECMPDPAEVSALRWGKPADLTRELRETPGRFTAWLQTCWPLVLGSAARPDQRA